MKKIFVLYALIISPTISFAEGLREAIYEKVTADHSQEMKSGDISSHRAASLEKSHASGQGTTLTPAASNAVPTSLSNNPGAIAKTVPSAVAVSAKNDADKRANSGSVLPKPKPSTPKPSPTLVTHINKTN